VKDALKKISKKAKTSEKFHKIVENEDNEFMNNP
jgi:hypothetical protein